MMRPLTMTLIALGSLFLGWELIARSSAVPPILLPSVMAVLSALWNDSAVFAEALRVTVAEIAVATAIVWTGGLLLGFLAASSRLAAKSVPPILMTIFTVPNAVMYPLILAWIGFGPESKVFYGVLSGITPVVINTWQGARAVDPAWLHLSRVYGAGHVASFTTVILPFAAPSIMSGLRIGTSLVVVGVLTAEMIGADAGLGFLIASQRALFNTGHVYAGILVALALVAVVQLLLIAAERQFVAWRERDPASA